MLTKAERTKQFIIEQAATIYNEKGIAGTNVDDILAATQLTKGAIYSHFENKQDLFDQVSDFLFEKICSGIAEAMKKETTAIGKIFAFLDFNKTPSKTYIKGGCPIFNMAVEANDDYPDVKSKICEVMLTTQRLFVNILSSGIKNNELSADLKPKAYAFRMFATIEGAVVMCRSINDDRPMKDVIGDLKKELLTYKINH